jgi:hypothetical protein
VARVTYSEDRGGRDIVFALDTERYRAGAASARCFRDVQAQFSTNEALDTIVSAVQLMDTVRARWPDAREPQLARGEHEVLGEAMLLAGGVATTSLRRCADSAITGTIEVALFVWPTSASGLPQLIPCQVRVSRDTGESEHRPLIEVRTGGPRCATAALWPSAGINSAT